jgi:hypothetical protein
MIRHTNLLSLCEKHQSRLTGCFGDENRLANISLIRDLLG